MFKMNNKTASALVIAAGGFWGVMGLFVRTLSGVGLNMFQITAIRLVIGTLMLCVLVLIYDKRLYKIELKDLPIFIGMGILSVLMMSCFYFAAILKTSLSTAAILLYTAPIWVLTASVIFYGEKLTVKKITALICAFVGCICVSGVSSSNVSVSGILCGLGSGFSFSLYSIIGKYALKKYQPLTVTVYSFIVAAIGSVFLADMPKVITLVADNFDVTMLLNILGIGFVTVFVPYLCYTLGLKHIPAGKAAIMASVEPMVATIAGIFAYGEIPNIIGFCGIVLIILSIVLLNINNKKEVETR